MLFNEVKVDAKIQAYFYPDESWYKPEQCNENTLQHEQLHFDITELFARKMRIQVEQATFSNNVKAEINDIYLEVLADLEKLQERYDWETDFSRNLANQEKWNNRIADALKRLEQ